MSRILAPFVLIFACLMLPLETSAQVIKKAQIVQPGDFVLSGSPTVFMDNGTNELALFIYGQYGLGNATNLRVRAGFFENNNYIGGNFEWSLKKSTPFLTFSAGGHYHNDPAADATVNLTVPLQNNLALYGGLDADLIFDDDPDLPLWVFLGFSYDLLNHVDMVIEFNYGFVEVAPHILASGFVFYF